MTRAQCLTASPQDLLAYWLARERGFVASAQ